MLDIFHNFAILLIPDRIRITKPKNHSSSNFSLACMESSINYSPSDEIGALIKASTSTSASLSYMSNSL